MPCCVFNILFYLIFMTTFQDRDHHHLRNRDISERVTQWIGAGLGFHTDHPSEERSATCHNGLPLMKHTEQWDSKLSGIYPLVTGKDF